MNCFCIRPIILLAALAFTTIASGQEPDFSTVREVRDYLEDREDVSIEEDKGWDVVRDRENWAFWSFIPENMRAYPAVFLRQVLRTEEGIRVLTWHLCEGAEDACEELAALMEERNDRFRHDLER